MTITEARMRGITPSATDGAAEGPGTTATDGPTRPSAADGSASPSEPAATSEPTPPAPPEDGRRARAVLGACFLGMFVVTLDAVVVNVALPHIRADLGGDMAGLQWVVDSYTLAVAALLLSAGALSDRIGAKRSFVAGMALFTAASVACGLAPSLTGLVLARVVQGAAAAALMPTSMALIAQAYTDPIQRARAVGMWALGGAVASSAGPVVGGALAMLDWRWVFLINVPVGAIALLLVRRAPASPVTAHEFDVPGLLLAALGIGALTWSVIESGAAGPGDGRVLLGLAVAVVGVSLFLLHEARTAHPMLPLGLFRSGRVSAATIIGFVFMACYYGTPFVMSLELQQHRGLTSLVTGVTFLPMMLIGLAITPLSARLVERWGRRTVVTGGLVVMACGLAGLAAWGVSASLPVVAGLLLLVGLGGPTVMPPVTATMLSAVPPQQAGTASGVLNMGRQVGGALSVALFGALLAAPSGHATGVHLSMGIAAVLALAAVATVGRLGSLHD